MIIIPLSYRPLSMVLFLLGPLPGVKHCPTFLSSQPCPWAPGWQKLALTPPGQPALAQLVVQLSWLQ